MQEIVGGDIQAIYPYKEPAAIVCNDEGLINGLPFNRIVEGGYGGVFGTFFVCGLTEDSFCSLTPEQMQNFKKRFHNAEILVGFDGETPLVIRAEPRTKNPHPKDKGRSAPGHDR